MDTITIIEMLNVDINQRKANKKSSNDIMVMSDLGAIKALENFRNHLQEYLDGQLNVLENKTEE